MSKWISVEERLPENETDCLVWRQTLDAELVGYSRVRTAFRFSGEWYDGGMTFDETFFKITHWQPLPAPPEAFQTQDGS